MVSLYDVFYVIAKNGRLGVKEVASELGKSSKEYQNVFNNILLLKRKNLVKKENKKISIVNSKRAQELFDLISFCLRNNINYNILLKDKMLSFLAEASKKEFFTNDDIKIQRKVIAPDFNPRELDFSCSKNSRLSEKRKALPFRAGIAPSSEFLLHSETFRFYTDALSKYGFLIIISKNPLKCKLLKSTFIIRLLKYFKKNPSFYVQKYRSHVPDITRELKKYRRSMKISAMPLNNIDKNREVGFIYSSLNLEGNPLTLPETEKLLIENVVPEKQRLDAIEEAINYKMAIDKMMLNSKNKIPLKLDIILSYHAIAMNRKEFAGKLRKENVYIKANPKFVTSEWSDVEKKLNILLIKYNDFESRKRDVSDTIKFAAYFHNEFQRIHPFIDGNSRISRLLMLHILRMHALPVLELPLGYFDSYLDLTKRSTKRDDERFNYLIEEIVLTNLKNLNNRMKE